jgi:hypothetical protein
LYSFCICLYWWVMADLSEMSGTRWSPFFPFLLWGLARGTLLVLWSSSSLPDSCRQFIAQALCQIEHTLLLLQILHFVVQDLNLVCILIRSFPCVSLLLPFLLFLGPIQNYNNYASYITFKKELKRGLTNWGVF